MFFQKLRYALCFRSAFDTDNMEQIAELIYQTDPYIYPYWIPNQADFVKLVAPKLLDPNFVFSYDHSYVVHKMKEDDILGLITILEPGKKLHSEIAIKELAELSKQPLQGSL